MSIREKLFPSRTRPPSSRPHVAAIWIWGCWFLGAFIPAAISGGAFVGIAAVLFLVLEAAAVVTSNARPWGFTFSEVVWGLVPWMPLRWALGVFLGLVTMLQLSVPYGMLLTMWLVPHFVMVGREYARYDRKVEALAQQAVHRNTRIFPSSIEFLQVMTGDLEVTKDAQRRMVQIADRRGAASERL